MLGSRAWNWPFWTVPTLCLVAFTRTLPLSLQNPLGLPRWLSSKEINCQCRRRGFDPWVEKIPWGRTWQPTAVLLPGQSHRQRSLSYSLWGHRRAGQDWAAKQPLVESMRWNILFSLLDVPLLPRLQGMSLSISLSQMCAGFLIPKQILKTVRHLAGSYF